MLKNLFHHAVDIIQHLQIPETQCAIALPRKEAVAPKIVGALRGFVMLSAVEFDDQVRTMLHEIQNVVFEWGLSPEVKASFIHLTQFPPQPLFNICRIATKKARLCNFVLSRTFEHASPPTRLAALADLPTRGR